MLLDQPSLLKAIHLEMLLDQPSLLKAIHLEMLLDQPSLLKLLMAVFIINLIGRNYGDHQNTKKIGAWRFK